MTGMLGQVLPFTALVGQPQLKLALTLLAVSPKLGGVLIRGEKGTAKSTAARALAAVLPPVRVNAGCRFGCPHERPEVWCDECRAHTGLSAAERPAPFETLPLGITEDQLLGTMDLEHALRHGERRFCPGLLAKVNQGVLYVDEVNLLDDHIVDLLLDAAAMGVNVVAREGISLSHPAELMLVGTMNPEEGELRPQLLDRFGLCAEVHRLDDPDARAELILRRLDFDEDPAGFGQRWQAQQLALTEQIAAARRLLPQIKPSRAFCRAAAEVALELEVDGHRADVLLVKSALALAALDGRSEIALADLEQAATVVLPHRLRRRPFASAAGGAERCEEDLRARAGAVLQRSLGGKKKSPVS